MLGAGRNRRGIGMGWTDLDIGRAVTLGIALLGAVLGVINTCWALWRDRVRIKVTPVLMTRVQDGINGQEMVGLTRYARDNLDADSVIGVQVVNLGVVECTVVAVGINPDGWPRRWNPRRRRVSAFPGDAMSQVRLPVRLAPRSGFTIWCPFNGKALDAFLPPRSVCFASTACGIVVFGNSPALRARVAFRVDE